MGESQGLDNLESVDSLMKLKNAVRRENRSFLVDCFDPSASSVRKDRMSSIVMKSISLSPNCSWNRLRMYS